MMENLHGSAMELEKTGQAWLFEKHNYFMALCTKFQDDTSLES